MKFSSILITGTAIGLVLALVRIAVLTRLLEISAYGEFTLLVIAAGFVTLVTRMAIVSGTVVSAFRGGDDDDVADDTQNDEDPPPSEARKILGTGLIGTFLIGATLAVAAATFGGPLGEALIGSSDRVSLVGVAVLGCVEAAFHLTATITRFERRPATFVALQSTNAILGIAVASSLVIAGLGIQGAVWGLAIGSGLALAAGFTTTRHRFALSFSFEHVKTLSRRGAPIVLITVGFWIFRHVDLLMISRYLTDTDVAIYRVASRVAAIGSSVVGGFIFARGPLMRGPMKSALHRQGLLVTADSRFFSYIWFAAVFILVGLFMARETLARVAPPEYESAATYIPLLGFASLATSGLTVIYRTSRLQGKRKLLTGLLFCMTPVFILLAVLLLPRLELTGAGLAAVAPPLMASSIYLWLSQKRGKEALELPWARMTACLAWGAVYALSLGTLLTRFDVLGEVLAVLLALLFPVTMVVLRILPKQEMFDLLSLVPRPGATRKSYVRRYMHAITPEQRELLYVLLVQHQRVIRVAEQMDVREERLCEYFVATLRELGDVGASRDSDGELGRFLLDTRDVGARDREGHVLASKGRFNALEVDALLEVVTVVESIRRRTWRRLRSSQTELPDLKQTTDGACPKS